MADKISIPPVLTDEHARQYYITCVRDYRETRLPCSGDAATIPLDAAAVKARYNEILGQALEIQNNRKGKTSELVEKIRHAVLGQR